MAIEVLYLELESGKSPFVDWELKLDKSIRAAIRARINRLRLGNFGDCKRIQGANGLYEIRVHLGAGYRIYFAKIKESIVIILCGGDKGSQERDIEKAKKYWLSYKKVLENGRKNGEGKKI